MYLYLLLVILNFLMIPINNLCENLQEEYNYNTIHVPVKDTFMHNNTMKHNSIKRKQFDNDLEDDCWVKEIDEIQKLYDTLSIDTNDENHN